MTNTLYKGTFLRFSYKADGKVVSEKYILAECLDDEYVFQVICISGYYAGNLEGYVRKDKELENSNRKGVSEKHLKEELHRNFLIVDGSIDIG